MILKKSSPLRCWYLAFFSDIPPSLCAFPGCGFMGPSIWKFLVHRFPLIFLALFIAVYIYVFVHHFCFEPDQCARVFIIVYFLPLYSLSLKLNFILAF